jgi:hypothetical protein
MERRDCKASGHRHFSGLSHSSGYVVLRGAGVAFMIDKHQLVPVVSFTLASDSGALWWQLRSRQTAPDLHPSTAASAGVDALFRAGHWETASFYSI